MDHRITSYLPRLLLQWYQDHPVGGLHQITEHSGLLLFADTSGFTALTRALAERGKVGFEILTSLLNDLFVALEKPIAHHGGDILKFSGDAVWCHFPPETDIELVFAEMLHQVECLNREHPICRTHRLSLHAGASAGSFQLVSFGDPSSRLEFEIVGSIIPEAYQAADVAGAGELACGESLCEARFSDQSCIRRDGFRVIRPNPVPSETANARHTGWALSDSSFESVEKYLPEAVRNRKLSDGLDTGLQSEHRQVAVMFANLLLSSECNDTIRSASSAVSEIFRVVEDHGGIVARIDPFVKGHKLLALFGALNRSESDRLNALKAAERILRQASAELSIRVGLSSGPLLCGEVGSSARHEYTVMGEAINLAARLMSKAEDQTILLDEKMQQHLSPLVTTSERKLSLKGVGNEVSVYRFESWCHTASELPAVTALVGRDSMLEELELLWQSRSRETAQSVFVCGEPGIGKTSLVSSFATGHIAEQPIYLSGYGAGLHQPGWLIAQWLGKTLALQNGADLAEEQLIEGLALAVDVRWRPLLDQLFGLTTPDNEWTRGLSAELRLAKSAAMVADLLGRSSLFPLVILDDLRAADSLSLMIIGKLIEEGVTSSLLLLLVDPPADMVTAHPECRQFALAGLDREQLLNWLKGQFAHGARERELCELIANRSEGNPLFVVETLSQLKSSGAIGHLTDEQHWEVLKPIDELKLAQRLEDLQLSRFDGLPESHRQVLKVAAVMNDGFTSDQLRRIAQASEHHLTAAILQELTNSGVLAFDPIKQEYRFARDLTRQAIYDCLPHSDLGPLHRGVAEMLLASGLATDILRLAYHYSRSDDYQKAFEYSLRAGKLAEDKGLLVEAAAGLKRCLQLLDSESQTVTDANARLDFWEWATKFSIREGNFSDAGRFVREWREQGVRLEATAKCHAAANELARILAKTSKYGRCQQVLEPMIRSSTGTERASTLAETYSLQAELCRRTGRIADSQAAALKAVELAQSGDDRIIESDSYNNLGLAYWTAGRLEEADKSFRRSMALQESSGSMYAEARVANNLAIISEELGDYNEARRLAAKAKDIFMELGDRRNQAYASGNLANLLVAAGQYRDATELYRSADIIFMKSGETHPHIYTVGNLGDLDLLLGDFDAARSKYKEVLAFASESGDEELDAEMSVRLAEHSYYERRSSEAIALYEEAIKKAEKVGSMEYRVRGTIGLCRCLIGERNVPEAVVAIDRLKGFAEESNSDRTRFEATFLTGELSRIKGEPQTALAFYRSCASYAAKQRHFELALKSLVRLTELNQEERQYSGQLRQLLVDFRTANGEQMYLRLLNSRYFKFFYKTMSSVCDSSVMESVPQGVAPTP